MKPMRASSIRSAAYEALVEAGPRLRPLQQVHAHIIVSGSHHSRALLTKLLTLACAAGSIIYTRQLFLCVPTPDSFLFNSIIKASSKFRFSHDAVLFYRRMLTLNIPPTPHTFTSVVKACADLTALGYGRLIHSHILICGYGLDSFVQAALVTFYSKSGDLGCARKVFDKMPERTVVAWNSMIAGYEQNGCAQEALDLLKQMRDSGAEPDSATFVSVLSACSQLGALEFGCWVHDYLCQRGFDINVSLGTSLINMYCRCGNVGKAREVFNQMKARNVRTWTAMISGYGTHGYGAQAIDLYRQMKTHGPSPNGITFIAVLSACGHAGLVEEGRQAIASMTREYGLLPGVEHHVCMVDMFGRAGMLDEAFRYIKEMIPGEPAPAVWTAMLGSCRMHKNFDLGVMVAERLLSIQPENPGHYVLLSNVYALAGRMDRVEMVRNMMMRRSLKKQVGFSTINVDQEIHLFSMGDKSHHETGKLYLYLDDLIQRCREAGYVPAPESSMHQLEEEEQEHALRYHSEKLAIAYGMMKTGHGTTLRIIKNLRMCEDCHSAIKFMSIVANREIIVRDKLRFHHFKDGACSCSEYW